MSLTNWFGQGGGNSGSQLTRDLGHGSPNARANSSVIRRRRSHGVRRHERCSVESLEPRQYLSVNDGGSAASLIWLGSLPVGRPLPAPPASAETSPSPSFPSGLCTAGTGPISPSISGGTVSSSGALSLTGAAGRTIRGGGLLGLDAVMTASDVTHSQSLDFPSSGNRSALGGVGDEPGPKEMSASLGPSPSTQAPTNIGIAGVVTRLAAMSVAQERLAGGGIGMTIGAGIGAVLGGAAGATGGTLAFPGGGTVALGGWGAVEGAALGGAVGGMIGVYLGDLTRFATRTRPGASLPSSSTPNDVRVEERPDGGTVREYGADGRAKTDYDFGHDHTGVGDPHAHDWIDGRRGEPRPLEAGE